MREAGDGKQEAQRTGEACVRSRRAPVASFAARRAEKVWTRRKRALTVLAFGALLLAFCLVPAGCSLLAHTSSGSTSPQTTDAKNASLLEIGSPAQLPVAPQASAELRIVSYNIRWRSGKDLEEIIKFLRDDVGAGRAVVIGLQEVDRNKSRSGNVNTARQLADALRMYYAWAAPPPARDAREEETGVALLSLYPMKDVVRLVLPHEGPNDRRRVAIGATVQMGAQPVRVYCVHSETRMATSKKIEQWRATLEDLARYADIKRVVVLGDLNTITGQDRTQVRKLFTDAGFNTSLPHDQKTFQRYLFVKLKLDWIWVRGMETTDGGVERQIDVSDHWPVWVGIKQKRPEAGGQKAGEEK